MVKFGPLDRENIAAAVAAAELKSDGEIVTVVAPESDTYHDVALNWAILAILFVPALLAILPGIARGIYVHLVDPWLADQPPAAALFLIALIGSALAFLVARLLLSDRRLRLALTPRSVKSRRVRRRALACYRLSTESRTRAKTAVLLYLSLAERRAEIVADDGIASQVSPERWGEAMAALIEAVKDKRPADGMIAAVGRIGDVLHHFAPRSSDDINELPDRLITL